MNNLEEKILNSKKILVDFYADWCGPCKMMMPLIDEVSKTIEVLKINVDENHEIAKKYGIMSIPCLILFEDGVEKKKNIGLISKTELSKFLED